MWLRNIRRLTKTYSNAVYQVYVCVEQSAISGGSCKRDVAALYQKFYENAGQRAISGLRKRTVTALYQDYASVERAFKRDGNDRLRIPVY